MQQGDDLTALRNVIYALSLQQSKNFNPSLVPFNQSKLTLLLKGSFTGNHKCVFIGCVSQSSLGQNETMSCLKLSRRAKMITNQMVPRVQTLSRSKTSKVLLKSTKKELQKNMSALDEKLALMTEELEKLKAQTVKTTTGTRSTTSIASHNKSASQDGAQKVKSATAETPKKSTTTVKEDGNTNEERISTEGASAVAVGAAAGVGAVAVTAGVGAALASDQHVPDKAVTQSQAAVKESSKKVAPEAKESSATDSGGSGITGAVGGAIAAVALGGAAVVGVVGGAVASAASTEPSANENDKASKKESSSSSTKEEETKKAATTKATSATVAESDSTEASNTALVAGAVVGATAAVGVAGAATVAAAEAGANTGERPREGNMQQPTLPVATVQSKGEKSEQFSTEEIAAGNSIILIDGMNLSDMDESSKLAKKRLRRAKNKLFTPRAYQTMPSISEYSDIDDDSNITPPSANRQGKSTDRVFHLSTFNSVSDISDDEDTDRSFTDLTLVNTSLSGSEDDEALRMNNRGHQEIKATEEVKTILKVDSSSFKFNSNFAQSLVLMDENDGEKNKKAEKEKSDKTKDLSSPKGYVSDQRSIGSNDVEQVLKEALGEESK